MNVKILTFILLVFGMFIESSGPSFTQTIESKPPKIPNPDSMSKLIITDSLLENKEIIGPRRHRHKLEKRFVDSDSDGINDQRCRGLGFGSKGLRRGKK
ncbi:MAG: hypothetical protein ACUVQ1_02730 [Candidatus Kapaibacteriales bacterium]